MTLNKKDYTLAVNSYIEKKPQEQVDPQKVKQEFLEAVKNLKIAEDKFKQLLIKGGYIHE